MTKNKSTIPTRMFEALIAEHLLWRADDILFEIVPILSERSSDSQLLWVYGIYGTTVAVETLTCRGGLRCHGTLQIIISTRAQG